MERHELLEMMGELQLSGMKAAFDEVLREALRCGHAVQRILGDLLKAELAEKRARSIRYRLAAAKLPLRTMAANTPMPLSMRSSKRSMHAILAFIE